MKNTFYIFLFLLSTVVAAGQQKPMVEATVDSAKIKIGSQFHLILKTNVDTLSKVTFPESKVFGRLEVLESYPVDTVKKDARYELIKKYGLTQFDSGRYVVPPLSVIINDRIIATDSFNIEITDIAVDTIKQQMFDIKPVIGTGSGYSGWLFYFPILFIIAGIGFLIYWFLTNRKSKIQEEIVYTTPIEKATTLLKNLERKNLLQKGDVKTYYSELTDIARTYIEETIKIPAMESTTAELIDALKKAVLQKKMNLTRETFEQLERVLKNADLVKFAKSKPSDFEIAEDRNKIEAAIVVLDKSLPEEIEEDNSNITAVKQQKLKEKKKQRIIIVSAIAGFLIIAASAYFISERGIGGLFKSETQRLLEGEWVTSEYGEPFIKLETPKVLIRYQEEAIQNNLPANVKSHQKFIYGNLLDDFSVTLSTTIYKEPTDIDKEKVINEELSFYEKTARARNIVLKTDDFETGRGITGKRAYGTMILYDPVSKKEQKMYYDILVLSQEMGVQQIIILHKEGDENAQKMVERIRESIELQTTQG